MVRGDFLNTCQKLNKKNIPVLILCGGRSVISNAHIKSQSANKGLIFIGNKPLFIDVMEQYINSHFKSFVLATGINLDLFVLYLFDNDWKLKGSSSSAVILE